MWVRPGGGGAKGPTAEGEASQQASFGGRAADNPSDECVTTVCAGRVEIDAKKSQKDNVKGVCGGDTHTMVDRSEQMR